MKLFENMTEDEKLQHIDNCRLNALECIRNGEPSNLADIADHMDIWEPYLFSYIKELKERINYLTKVVARQEKDLEEYEG